MRRMMAQRFVSVLFSDLQDNEPLFFLLGPPSNLYEKGPWMTK